MSKDVIGIATDEYLAKQDERASQLGEFDELTKQFFDTIEESISHIKNKAESFLEIDLDDEIKSRILELL